MVIPVNVRRYQESDRNEVWVLWHTALGNLTPEQVPSTDQYQGDDKDLLHIPENYLSGDGEFLVGVYAGQVVAICGMKKSTATKGEIRHLSVHIKFHRCGIGRIMMQAMEQRAKDLNCKMLHLDTSISQIAAQKFYLACGFHEVGHTYVGVGKWEIILYEKELGE